MISDDSGYFPLKWDSGVKQTMSKDSEEAFCKGLTDERRRSRGAIESGPELF